MKLLTKYIRINIILVVCVFLLSAGALYVLVNKTLIHELDEELADIKGNIEHYIRLYHTVPQNSTLYDYQLKNTVVTDTFGLKGYVTVTKYIVVKEGHRKFRHLTFYLSSGGKFYRVTIEKQIEGMKIMARNIIKLSLVTILFVIAILIFINRLVFNKLWKPFYQTLAIMRNFELNKENDLNFPKTNVEEFNYMNDILKRTSQKAGEEYIALKEFTENASHELQTPLSIISSKLDLLIQDEQLSARHIQTITGAYSALKKMAQLNQSLLLLAKIGNQQFSSFTTISLDTRLNEKIEQFHELWQDQELKLTTDIQQSNIHMNYDLNDILINNLLSNASNHNISGGMIGIVLRQGILSITNSGSGTPLRQQKIFKRFYKSDQSISSNGLGLSIIKQICDASGITITYSFYNNLHSFQLSWLSTDSL